MKYVNKLLPRQTKISYHSQLLEYETNESIIHHQLDLFDLNIQTTISVLPKVRK